MLYEQVMEPRYAPCETSAGPFEKTFMDNHSIFINMKTDDQFNLLSNAVLEPIAGVQKRNEHSAQGIPMAEDELIKSKGTTDIHQAAAVTTDEIDDGKITLILIQAVQLC